MEGLHSDLHPALARCNAPDAVVAEEDGKAVRKGGQAGWGGGQGGIAGLVGWQAGSGGGLGGGMARWSEGDGSSE